MVTKHQYGLLSETEREWLGEAMSASDTEFDREELVEQLRKRLRVTLGDIEGLYMALTDEELATIFADTEDEFGSIRSSAQHLLAFLYLGLQANGDDVEFRLTSAIEQAEATRNRRTTVQLDVVTEPFLPPAQRLKALREEGFRRLSYEEFDQLFYDDHVPPEDLAAVLSAIESEEVSPETIRREREAVAEIERLLPAVVVDVERADTSELDGGNIDSGPCSSEGDE